MCSFYGTDSYVFVVGLEYGLGNNTLNARVYTSFNDAAREVVESRFDTTVSLTPPVLLKVKPCSDPAKQYRDDASFSALCALSHSIA